MAALAALYWTTAEYAILAQRINWEWMSGSSPPAIPSGEQVNSPKKHSKCDEPLVLVSKRGKDVIGTLVMKVVKRKRKAYVRAWTINSAQRNKGFGGGLLEDGVRTAWGKGARAFEFEYEYACESFLYFWIKKLAA